MADKCQACGREQWVGGRLHDCRALSGGGFSVDDQVRHRESGRELGTVVEVQAGLGLTPSGWNALVRPPDSLRSAWWPTSMLEVVQRDVA